MKTDTGKSIDWAKVTFIFCDERLVPFDNPESTLGLYLNLFKDTDIKEEQFLKVAVDLDVESAAKVKSVIDGAADCFDNRKDANRVTSAILLLANCRLKSIL